RVAIGVMGRGPPVRRDVCRVCEDCCDACLEAGDRAVALRAATDLFRVAVLVHEFCRVVLAGLLYGRVIGARAHIRYTPERVVQDDGLDKRVERVHVPERCRKLADRTLYCTLWCEVCHFSHFLCFFSGVSGRPLTHTCGRYGVLRVSGGWRSGAGLRPVPGSEAIGVQKEGMGAIWEINRLDNAIVRRVLRNITNAWKSAGGE